MGMRLTFVTSATLALALAACGSNTETATPEAMETGDVAAADTMAPDAAATGAPAAAPTAAPAFVAAAASGGMYEVESSKLAQDKATNADVKAFAAMMIKDHTKANDELKAAAGKATPPATVPAKMDAEHQAMLDQLRTATNFDKTYLDQQRTAHEKTLALLNGYSTGGDSQPLKDWASKNAPVVKAHHDKVSDLASKM
jgi:putative membrane protein